MRNESSPAISIRSAVSQSMRAISLFSTKAGLSPPYDRRMRLLLLAILATVPAFAAQDWGPAQFLIGEWRGEGNGRPGTGAGAFSFAEDVQGRVLVRKSYAEYPATGGKPA